jgi:hypoxanthine-guanine phosphoribosyltransferase
MADIFDTTTTINTLLKSFTFFKRGNLAILFVILINKKEEKKSPLASS